MSRGAMAPAVDIILDGKRFAYRNWTIIPSVGDFVLLHDGEIKAQVTCVAWGDDAQAPVPEDRQWIQLVCKTVDAII